MPRLFMSYARESRPHVERLAADLRSSGYDPFFDEQLVGGQNWWNELLTRIEASDAFMPVLASGYLSSTPCQLEAAYATALGKPFLPVAIENLPPQLFSREISEAHWASYDPKNPPSVLSVIRAINALPPAAPLPDPRPERPRVPISYMTELQEEIGGETEISRARQLQIVADLRSRLTTDDRDAAALLLRRLRSRPDIGYQVAMDIDQQVGRREEPVAESLRPPPPELRYGVQSGQGATSWQQQPDQRRTASTTSFTSNGPRGQQSSPVLSKPNNYMVWTILSTVLFCPGGLLGIVGIVQSFKVDALWAAGEHTQAAAASKSARTWAMIAVGTGLLLWLIYIIGLAASTSSSSTI